MYKNRIRGIRCRASGHMIAKPISIKGTGCKSADCVRKVVELTSGDLPFVAKSRLRGERSFLTGRQKSAEGKVVPRSGTKARTVPHKGLMGEASKQRDSWATSGRKTS